MTVVLCIIKHDCYHQSTEAFKYVNLQSFLADYLKSTKGLAIAITVNNTDMLCYSVRFSESVII